MTSKAGNTYYLVFSQRTLAYLFSVLLGGKSIISERDREESKYMEMITRGHPGRQNNR